MNSEIVYLLSEYLDFANKLMLRRCCKSFASSIYWRPDEVCRQLANACASQADSRFLDSLIDCVRARTDSNNLHLFGATSIIRACGSGSFTAAQRLMLHGRFHPLGDTALRVAIQHNVDVDTLKLLLRHTNNPGRGILCTATICGAEDVVKHLLSDPRLTGDSELESSFDYAIRYAHLGIFKMFLQHPPDIRRAVSFNAPVNLSPLCRAVESKDSRIVKLLLRDDTLLTTTINNAFRLALKGDSARILSRFLHDRRVNPRHPWVFEEAIDNRFSMKMLHALLIDGRGDPSKGALEYAAERGKVDAVRLLLGDHRIDPESGYNGALILAAGYGHAYIVRILLERANPAKWGNRAVCEAVSRGHLNATHVLLCDRRIKVVGPYRVDGIEYPDLMSLAKGRGFKKMVDLIRLHEGQLLGSPCITDQH